MQGAGRGGTVGDECADVGVGNRGVHEMVPVGGGAPTVLESRLSKVCKTKHILKQGLLENASHIPDIFKM